MNVPEILVSFRQKIVSEILTPIHLSLIHSSFDQKCIDCSWPCRHRGEQGAVLPWKRVQIKGEDRNAHRQSQHNTGAIVPELCPMWWSKGREEPTTVSVWDAVDGFPEELMLDSSPDRDPSRSYDGRRLLMETKVY